MLLFNYVTKAGYFLQSVHFLQDATCAPGQKCVVKVVQCVTTPCPSKAEAQCFGKYKHISFPLVVVLI